MRRQRDAHLIHLLQCGNGRLGRSAHRFHARRQFWTWGFDNELHRCILHLHGTNQIATDQIAAVWHFDTTQGGQNIFFG